MSEWIQIYDDMSDDIKVYNDLSRYFKRLFIVKYHGINLFKENEITVYEKLNFYGRFYIKETTFENGYVILELIGRAKKYSWLTSKTKKLNTWIFKKCPLVGLNNFDENTREKYVLPIFINAILISTSNKFYNSEVSMHSHEINSDNDILDWSERYLYVDTLLQLKNYYVVRNKVSIKYTYLKNIDVFYKSTESEGKIQYTEIKRETVNDGQNNVVKVLDFHRTINKESYDEIVLNNKYKKLLEYTVYKYSIKTIGSSHSHGVVEAFEFNGINYLNSNIRLNLPRQDNYITHNISTESLIFNDMKIKG